MTGSVQVLLPVFNGARHLAELVESLGRQDQKVTSLLVRDDGSSDDSLTVLQEAARRWDLSVRVAASGPRLGPFGSFFALLAESDPSIDYVAFADQDDVWLPDKLSRAVAALAGAASPVCYGSAVRVTDELLTPLDRTTAPRGGASFLHALAEVIAPTSTLVLPAATRDLLVQRLPAADVYPDLWCYQVCAGLGRFLYDPEPSLLYRQHQGNAVGLATTWWGKWAGRLRRGWSDVPGLGSRHWDQLAELLRLFGDELKPADLAALTRLLATRQSWRQSASYAVSGPIVRRTRTDAWALRATLLLPPRARSRTLP